MKIYYFLNNISKSSFDIYLSKIELLKEKFSIHDLIDKYYAKNGVYIKNAIQDSNFLEILSFIEFISKKYKLSYQETLETIKWIHDDNFFIYNDRVFIQGLNKYNELNIKNEKVYFVTSRDIFTSPFFLILNSINKFNKNIKIVKFNIKLNHWSYNDKAYYISKLYKYRKGLIGDIIFPLFQNKEDKNINMFFNKTKELLGNKVIIKKNFGNMGEGLKALDLNIFKSKDVELLKSKFISNNNFTGFYITPFIDIKKEYRIYYRYDKKIKKVNIYSIKQRINENIDEVFSKPSLRIYQNIKTKWLYINKKELERKYIDKIDLICKIMKDNIGVLELFEDESGKIFFCEINHLGGSLMFPGRDKNDMLDYYIDTWKMIY